MTAGAKDCRLLAYIPSTFFFRPYSNRLFLHVLKIDASTSMGSPLAESPTREPRSGVSPVSRLRPPSAGRRRRSSPSSPGNAPRPRDKDTATPYSTSPPLQRRRLYSPAQGKTVRVPCGDGGAIGSNDAPVHTDSTAACVGRGCGGGGDSPDRVRQRGEPETIVPRGMRGSESSATIPNRQEGTLNAGDGSHELARLKTVRNGMCSASSSVEGRPTLTALQSRSKPPRVQL